MLSRMQRDGLKCLTGDPKVRAKMKTKVWSRRAEDVEKKNERIVHGVDEVNALMSS